MACRQPHRPLRPRALLAPRMCLAAVGRATWHEFSAIERTAPWRRSTMRQISGYLSWVARRWLLKQGPWYFNAALEQFVYNARNDSGGYELADDLASSHAAPFEAEDVLQLRREPFQADDLRHHFHAANAI